MYFERMTDTLVFATEALKRVGRSLSNVQLCCVSIVGLFAAES